MGQGPRVSLSCELLEDRLQPTVTYHGGALLPHVQPEAVYIGSNWATYQGYMKIRALDTYLSFLVQSPYMDALTQAGYAVGRGFAVSGAIIPTPLNPSYYFTDAQIQYSLQWAISTGRVYPPNGNRLYVVYIEPGIAVWDGTGDSISDFIGYHGAFGGRNAAGQPIDIHYAVMPYPGGWNGSPQSQGFPTNFAQLTAVTSHELAEAVTDPNVDYKAPGWYDDQLNVEIGDLTPYAVRVLGGYYVQLLINQVDRLLNVAYAVYAPPTYAPTGGPSGMGFDAIANPNPYHLTPLLSDDFFAVSWGVRVGRGT